MLVECQFEDERWLEVPFVALTEQAVSATLGHLGVDDLTCEVSVLACDDETIAGLNTTFRRKNQPTNVLSWPAHAFAPFADGEAPTQPIPGPDGVLALGDIAIAFETCAREAADMDKPLADHLSHLMVHGVLHLCGYDHERDRDAAVMQALEIKILCKLGISDPYSDQSPLGDT